jgi:hypothetical protein
MTVATKLELMPSVHIQSWKTTPFAITSTMFSGRLLGSEPLQVCSWSTFLNYWKAKYPNLTIRQPCEDVWCGECTIYRNCWKYGARAEENSEEEDARAQEDNDRDDGYSLTTPAILEQEKLIANAILHVEQSIAMREMAY